MTRYRCSNGHVFVHPAIKTVNKWTPHPIEKSDTKTVPGAIIQTTEQTALLMEKLETHICPYPDCGSIEYSEFDQPTKYEDWQEVKPSQVKEYLDKGYSVLSHTKDAAIVVKCEVPKT